MKKLYFLLLFCSGIALAQPNINQPADLYACDNGNDGVENFDLTNQMATVMNGLSTSEYFFGYYFSLSDAIGDINPFASSNNFTAVSATDGQTWYIRVHEIANPDNYAVASFTFNVDPLPSATMSASLAFVCVGDFAAITFQGYGATAPYTFSYSLNGGVTQTITSDVSAYATINLPTATAGVISIVLHQVTSATGCIQYLSENINLTVLPVVTANQPPDLTLSETPTDGFAIFDLTANEAIIAGSQSNLQFYYYLTQADADAQVNTILPTTAFTNTSNPQTIFVRANDVSGACGAVTSFDLHVVDSGIVYIPDANFKALLIAASATNQVGSTVLPNSGATPDVYSVIDTNVDGEIQFSEAAALRFLDVSSADIASLQGIEAFTNLEYLYCNSNDLTTLDLGDLPVLKFVNCEDNLVLASVDLSGVPALETFSANNNAISSIDFSANNQLEAVYLNYNDLTTLSLDNATNIASISANWNNLTGFSIADKDLLTTLQLINNQMTSVTLTNLPHLYKVRINNNQLTEVDLSTVAYEPFLNNIPFASEYEIAVNNNLALTAINLKNGFTNPNISFVSANSNNNVQYVCKDEDDVFTYLSVNDGVFISTYCNFGPGGSFNTIDGTLTFDGDNNGCDASDINPSFLKIKINDGIEEGYSFSSQDGDYGFYTQEGTFILTPQVENPSIFNFSPTTASVTFADNNSNTETRDFCVSANGIHHDLEVVIVPVMPSRPGFDAVYKIVLHNKGNQLNSGVVTFAYNENVLDWISSVPLQDSQSAGSLTFNYSNLQPFESRVISQVTLNVNGPMETPAVNIGDVLNFVADASSMNGTDDSPSDNIFNYNETVVGSFDPNDKKCLQGTIAPPELIGDFLHYMIRFENTGTAPAENIVIKDIIDPTKFDVNSVQILDSSHHVVGKGDGNGTIFIFQDINLDSGGHGNILLKVKTLTTLVEGDTVTNKANIYFDYNFPIETDLASTTFQTLSVADPEFDGTIRVFPNPASDMVTIKANSTIQSVELYDMQGRLLEVNMAAADETKISLAERSTGIYFVKVITQKGTATQKLIKK
ncbi:MAG: T9SS type A sorting domain-containing protein [Flavobacterium sp.]|uniref:DUF7619 domain-containing protein n=1 Tax=Flavobacterium sp. TaxID=239 RepID=UPI0011F97913|nr:T9SS type A sorting domain-containing protein [Flavobacterium sp.]RZJ64183.1 MAG: T9SS type A sorting domain-containing protein [Flavobacterium sp.]